jgi:intracellular sulfur oxidation DsrE/DsrF family protein
VKTVFVINSDTMGRGHDRLQTLVDMPEKPLIVAFYNGGVRLLCEGSPVLDPLGKLQAAGVELLACGTCLDFFELRAHILVGRASNMREITSALLTADKVVTL